MNRRFDNRTFLLILTAVTGFAIINFGVNILRKTWPIG